jgi:acetylornithine deacetylase/succinyl-diaminopimelate desuccinylase-like protein
MPRTFEEIIAELPAIRDKIYGLRELLLTNLVVLGETPAPTFFEEMRVQLLNDRFRMSGLDSASEDEIGNAFGILPGTGGKRDILVVTHADSILDESVDHTVTIQPGTVTGAGLCNNALGLAILATLPTFIEELGLEFKNNLVLMGAVQSLGRGNLGGLQFFLENTDRKIACGLCLDSLELGRISNNSTGMLRGEIEVKVPKEYDWTRDGITGAIQVLGELIGRISEIPLPHKPRTVVVMGSVRGGNTYNVIATKASLRFEIRSESEDMVAEIFSRIEAITGEVASISLADVSVSEIARRHPGGVEFAHPLVRTAREAFKALGVEPHNRPSTSELATFIEQKIPAISMGFTVGEEISDGRDVLHIDEIFTGVAALIGLLLAIDGGYCEND